MEIDISNDIVAKDKEGKTLNKPFRLPSGSKKKFGVYVKNDKGNVVMVKFGDPNMEIKRDDPARRKNYRARHNCDNPGPKWKANYWSCKMWSSKPVSKIAGNCQCEEDSVLLEAEIISKNKGLWYNIQQKKKRMGKNYTPAKPGDEAYPDQNALKKAQAEEWDGESLSDQEEILRIWPDLSKAQEVEEMDEEMNDEMEQENEDASEMALSSFSATVDKLNQLIQNIKSNPEMASELSEPWLISKIAIIEDYTTSIHHYLIYPKE